MTEIELLEIEIYLKTVQLEVEQSHNIIINEKIIKLQQEIAELKQKVAL